MHCPADARDRPERRREVEIVGGEIAGRSDLATWPPVDPPVAPHGAVDQRDHAFGEAGDHFRLRVRAEGQAGHVEQGAPGSARQAMLYIDIGDQAAAVGRAQRPIGANIITGQSEVQVVGAQRIEARIIAAVGNPRTGVDGQVAFVHAPFAIGLVEQQRDIADARLGLGENATDPASGESAAKARSVEQDRRIAAPQLHRDTAQGEALADDLPTGGGELERRAANAPA